MIMIFTYLKPVTKFILNLFYLSENEKSRSRLPGISILDLEKTIYKPTLIPINFLHKNLKVKPMASYNCLRKIIFGLASLAQNTSTRPERPEFFRVLMGFIYFLKYCVNPQIGLTIKRVVRIYGSNGDRIWAWVAVAFSIFIFNFHIGKNDPLKSLYFDFQKWIKSHFHQDYPNRNVLTKKLRSHAT